jgi:NAD(P)-dependent dehydrogenase (short-subunit alcohol dehydrogenase family)
MNDLNGKVAVITGGASGIGFATAAKMAQQGARIVLADIEASALDQALSDLRLQGATVKGVVCDVGDLASVENLAQSAFAEMGAVHLVFNNAGVAVGGPISEMKHADWEWIIRVDLWGPIHGVEAFLPRMIKQKQGGHV